MTCSRCAGAADQFGDRVARRQLRRYRRKGATKTTKMLLDAITPSGVTGVSFLDIGGGVGAIQHALMRGGAASGTSVDASPSYLHAAKEEATAQGYVDRMRYLEGDFVDASSELGAVDLVTLDRVVCCYPDLPSLVDASASRARHAYGLVYPRDTALARVAVRMVNFWLWMLRNPFRAFVHPTADVEARVSSHGFQRSYHAHWTMWQVVVFTRPEAEGRS